MSDIKLDKEVAEDIHTMMEQVADASSNIKEAVLKKKDNIGRMASDLEDATGYAIPEVQGLQDALLGKIDDIGGDIDMTTNRVNADAVDLHEFSVAMDGNDKAAAAEVFQKVVAYYGDPGTA